MEHTTLRRAPLVQVVAQVQFPLLTNLLSSPDRGQEFAGEITSEYPVLLSHDGSVMGGGGLAGGGLGRFWRFGTADGTWAVGLGDTFASISTSAYYRRGDFLDRLAFLWDAVVAVIDPPYLGRFGFRYVNQQSDGDAAQNASRILRPEVRGFVQVPIQGAVMEHSLSQGQFVLDGGSRLLVRSGVLPPDVIIDENLPPVQGQSWVLDIDAFVQTDGPGDLRAVPTTASVVGTVEDCAERAYRFFRWAITDAALDDFQSED